MLDDVDEFLVQRIVREQVAFSFEKKLAWELKFESWSYREFDFLSRDYTIGPNYSRSIDA